MQEYKTSRSKRIASGIIGIMMLVIMLFSAFYIASEAVHDCSGEDCPVCTCIQLCKNSLHQTCVSTTGHSPLLFLSGLVLLLKALFEVIRPHDSLITRKIRMNN